MDSDGSQNNSISSPHFDRCFDSMFLVSKLSAVLTF